MSLKEVPTPKAPVGLQCPRGTTLNQPCQLRYEYTSRGGARGYMCSAHQLWAYVFPACATVTFHYPNQHDGIWTASQSQLVGDVR
jgi:hypothetical protein